MFKPDVLQLFLRDLFILSQFLPRYCSVNMSQAFPDPSINFFPVWERQTPLFLLRRLKQMSHNYYRLCSTTKRERFFAHVSCSKETVSQIWGAVCKKIIYNKFVTFFAYLEIIKTASRNCL